MHPLEKNDHVGLENFFVHILALRVKSRALNMFHHVANPLVTAMFVDRFPLSEIRDWDSYRNGEGLIYPNEFWAVKQFCRDKGHGRNFEHDRKRELYRVDNAAANVVQASQQVSPPKNETFAPKLNLEARPFNNNAPTKCDFPNCNQSFPHFLGKCPVFKSKSAFDRQKWVTAKNLCAICFKKAHTHVSQCCLLEVMKKLDRKICGVNGCNI